MVARCLPRLTNMHAAVRAETVFQSHMRALLPVCNSLAGPMICRQADRQSSLMIMKRAKGGAKGGAQGSSSFIAWFSPGVVSPQHSTRATLAVRLLALLPSLHRLRWSGIVQSS